MMHLGKLQGMYSPECPILIFHDLLATLVAHPFFRFSVSAWAYNNNRGVQNFLKSLIFKTLNLPKRLFSMLAAYPRSNILGLILNVLLPRLFTI